MRNGISNKLILVMINKNPSLYLGIFSFTNISTWCANLRQLRLYSYERGLFSGFGCTSYIFVRYCAHLWGHAENYWFMTNKCLFSLVRLQEDTKMYTGSNPIKMRTFPSTQIFFLCPLVFMHYFLLYYFCTGFDSLCQSFYLYKRIFLLNGGS